jgi:hypothetical protein
LFAKSFRARNGEIMLLIIEEVKKAVHQEIKHACVVLAANKRDLFWINKCYCNNTENATASYNLGHSELELTVEKEY